MNVGIIETFYVYSINLIVTGYDIIIRKKKRYERVGWMERIENE